MFKKKEDRILNIIDAAIDECATALAGHMPEDDEYAKTTDQIEKLMKMRETHKSKKRVSPDTIAVIAANLGGIIIVMYHERANVIATKAFSSLLKPKI